MKTGAERLKDYRDRCGYNQRELAELLGIHFTYLSQLLAGRRRPRLPMAVHIEQVTGIPVESWVPTRLSTSSKRRRNNAIQAPVGGV